MIKFTKRLSILAVLSQLFFTLSTAEELQPVVLECEKLTFKISISRTAHLFHIVDQLSEWSQFCHNQYTADFINYNGSLSSVDKNMLEKHALVRKALPWGSGLEQTFYTTMDLRPAVADGIRKKYITPEQGEIEIEVFEHFAPYIDQLIETETQNLNAFAKSLLSRKSQLNEISNQLSLFCDSVKLEIPFFILANPCDNTVGGGYNGRRLTLEIPRKRDSFNSLLHELMHAYISSQSQELEKIVKATEGLDYTTLNEGIAYAFSPGIFHSSSKDQDPLLHRVRADINKSKSLQTDYSTRVYRYGLALRPLLIDTFEKKQSIRTFLPRARDAWLLVNEFDSAISDESHSKHNRVVD
jgi:hypothetical protein